MTRYHPCCSRSLQAIAAPTRRSQCLALCLGLTSNPGCRLASSYATARHYAHRNHLVALAMFEWHSFARQQKAMRQHLRQAVKHYDGRKLQGQVFQHWKRWCNLEGRANVCPHNCL